ncbi:MAG: hypothetical protein JKY36_04265 [Erythrobacter sp.]|nr:hypothetical protein [Erythrobacter sp.]
MKANMNGLVDIDWLANPIREAYDGSPAEIAIAVLEAIRSAGYVVVPVEPSEAMVRAFWFNLPSPYDIDMEDEDAAKLCIRAMIAAAEGE